MRVGEVFNESTEFADEITGRPSRRLTCSGLYNQTPTYHLHAAFSADSRSLVFASAREGGSALLTADLATGDLTVVAVTDGIGGDRRSSVTEATGPHVSGSLGGGFTGNGLAILQATNLAAAVVGGSLRVYDLRTFDERVLIEDVGDQYRFGAPIGSVDGSKVIITRVPAHPDLAAGQPRTMRTYRDACNQDFGGMPTTYLQIDIGTGQIEEVFQEAVYGSHHVQPCPTDADLWLIDRDAPPNFWAGGDGEMTRAWLLHVRTGALVELDPHDENGFQIHTNWNAAGTRVYYHGRSRQGEGKGHYIGVADTQGSIVWEQHYPRFYYGHMSTHTTQEAVITDGLLSLDLVVAIHYEDRDATGLPRVEALARHATEWTSAHGQLPHPHCHMTPNARWLSYNRAAGWRSDVYVTRTG